MSCFALVFLSHVCSPVLFFVCCLVSWNLYSFLHVFFPFICLVHCFLLSQLACGLFLICNILLITWYSILLLFLFILLFLCFSVTKPFTCFILCICFCQLHHLPPALRIRLLPRNLITNIGCLKTFPRRFRPIIGMLFHFFFL